MKAYPSIPKGCIQHFKAHVFDKIDGSCLRFCFTKKRGWHKYGTRTRLFDQSDLIFGPAIDIFHNGLAKQIADIAIAQKWEEVIAFAEFYGPNSFAGIHLSDDPKFLALFDISVHRKGILPPNEFLKLFGNLEIANFLGIVDWNKDFVLRVRRGLIDGITFEGVVGKGVIKNKLTMEKAKTQKWIDKVKALRSPEDAEKIINS